MRNVFSRAASRHSRDRDVFPDGPRPGPYDAAYDVRRGYNDPAPAAAREYEDRVLLAGRDEARD